MSRFLLQFDIKIVNGYQTYAVYDARDAEHALELHNQGKSEFYDQDICVEELHEIPDIESDD